MPIIELEAIEEVGAHFIARLGDELQEKTDAFSKELARVEREAATQLGEALKKSTDAGITELTEVFNGNAGVLNKLNRLLKEETLEQLSALLTKAEETSISRFDALINDSSNGALSRLDALLATNRTKLDEQTIARLASFNEAADARLTTFDQTFAKQIEQTREEILDVGFHRLRATIDSLMRKFVRATLLLLNLAGFLVLALSSDGLTGSSATWRAGLFAMFVVISLFFFFSDPVLDSVIRTPRRLDDRPRP